jgi:tetratricopeptide (TPR) repeat protein
MVELTPPFLLALRLALEEVLGPLHPRVATLSSAVGGTLCEQGRLDEALDCYQRALAIMEGAYGPHHPDLVHPLVGLAEVALIRRELATAREHAERIVALTETGAVSAYLLTDARFILARVLWTDQAELPRARMLAEQARDGYATLGDLKREDLVEVERWLAEHVVR